MPTVLVLALFGLATITSGLIRYLTQDGGEKGLWFGIVMGSLSLAGALTVRSGRRKAGLALGWTALAFVVGWFSFEVFVRKGLGQAEIRQIVLLAFALMCAGMVATAKRPA